MPTLVEALRQRGRQEPLPEWLAGDGAPDFDRERFFASRTVYYPGSGFDGHPVKLCSLSHAAHTFVYVDQGIDEADIKEELQDPVYGFRGYKTIRREHVSEETLRPSGWMAHAELHEVVHAGDFAGGFAMPFALFVVLEREKGLDCSHGPRRLAILFVGGDGYATFDALYCQGDGTPTPFMVVLQDHAWGGNFGAFGGGGLLEQIAIQCGARPGLLLIADNTVPWQGYRDVGAEAERGGGGQHLRRLFQRRVA